MLDFSAIKPLPGALQMHEWDAQAIEFGIPGNMLMENAGSAIHSALAKMALPENARYTLFMGSGNNGGDAACLARYLADSGAKVLLLHTAPLENLKGEAAWHAHLAERDLVPMRLLPENPDLDWLRGVIEPCVTPIFIDGLLGTGFSSELRPAMQGLISAINALAEELRCQVFAIDVPSGLNADTGLPQPIAIRANATFTLAAAKPGLVLPDARRWVGTLHCLPIGFPRALDGALPWQTGLIDGRLLLSPPPYPPGVYKNSFGLVLVLGGAGGLEGAAHLASAAALRSGAGLVACASLSHSEAGVKCGWPEIMFLPLGHEWPAHLDEPLLGLLGRASACVIGPGMGRDAEAGRFLKCVLEANERPPAVIDADALTILGQQPALLKYVRASDVCTPHPGEAGRLLGLSGAAVQGDRQRALAALCDLAPAVWVLKGAGTMLGQSGQKRFLCPYDIPQLAIGGAGDVLAGAIGARLAMGTALEAAIEGVVNHAMAGLALSRRYSRRGLLASELANALAEVGSFLNDLPVPEPDVTPWPNSI